MIAGVVSFVAGCLAGSSAEPTGRPHCIVSELSAPSRPDAVPGDVVAAARRQRDGAEAETAAGDGALRREPGCLPGGHRICGWIDHRPQGPPRFVSQACPR